MHKRQESRGNDSDIEGLGRIVHSKEPMIPGARKRREEKEKRADNAPEGYERALRDDPPLLRALLCTYFLGNKVGVHESGSRTLLTPV